VSAYVVFTREKTIDPTEMEIYHNAVQATFAGHDVKILAAYGPYEDLEGPPTEGSVIAEFPSMEAAKAWYDSSAYRAVREHRFKGAIYRVCWLPGCRCD
jgi:uncharacterized protein (DUF1330 family)